MNTGTFPTTKTGTHRRTTDVSFILTQAAVATGFLVFFEPAPCDILALFALVAGLPVMSRNIPKLPRIVLVSLPVFLLVNAVGLTGAVSLKAAVRFFGITAYLIAFAILIYSLTLEKDGFRRQLINAYMIAAFATAALIWTGFLGNILSLPTLSRMTFADRPMGLFKDPNVAGSFLMPAALFLSGKALDKGKAGSLGSWVALFLMVSAIFHTASRSAVLCWGLGVLVMTSLSGTSQKRKIAHLAGIAFIVLVVLPVMYTSTGNSVTISLSGRVLPHTGYVRSVVFGAKHYMARIAAGLGLGRLFAEGTGLLQSDDMRQFAVGLYEYDTGGRLYAWQAALELWRSHPVIGVGPGNFEFLSPGIQRALGASFITPSTHNTYLRVLAENGVVGLAALVIPLILTVVAVAKAGAVTVAKAGRQIVGRACDEAVRSADTRTVAGRVRGNTADMAGSRTVGGACDRMMGNVGGVTQRGSEKESNVGGTARQGTDNMGKAGAEIARKTCNKAETAAMAAGRNSAVWLTGDRLWLTGNGLWLTASLVALVACGLFIDSLHFRHLWLLWALALREVSTIELSI
ncbi:MAG: O-antigen ligase family protein [Firmicutes bacterium]|nr:O-antigen ligase family protein [Bacillota bacterium]